MLNGMIGDAVFSKDGEYRWWLSRKWLLGEGICAFIMLNSSTAGASRNDPTVTRCCDFAHRWGFGGLLVGNLFGLVSTDPSVLSSHPHPVGRENDDYLLRISRQADLVVCAWGKDGKILGRGEEVKSLLRSTKKPLHYLRMNKDGTPTHPLYLPANLNAYPLVR